MKNVNEIKRKRRNILGIRHNDISGWLFLVPVLFCIYISVLRPQIQGIYWSFFDMNGYEVKDFVGMENYRRVINNSVFVGALKNTMVYVVYSILLGFFVPIILAVALNEITRLRTTARFFIYLPCVLPGASMMLLWYFIYYPDAGGLLNMLLMKFGMEPYVWLQDAKNTILYIVIAMTWSGCGGTTLYYFASLQGINRELYEAALIDGAGFFRRLFTVTVPHISGIAVLFLVQQIIGVFSVTEQPMQMTDGGPNGASTTLGLEAYRYGFVSMKPNYAMAIGVIMFLILLVMTCFYFILNKKIEENVD